MAPHATVILPTTGERWELVQYSLAAVLAQDGPDMEVLIVGDGVGPRSRERYADYASADPRIRFFDYPKHARRGEPYRHELLMSEARGRIVLYCCDRDLWFRHHLATIAAALERYDFANTLAMFVERTGGIREPARFDTGLAHHRRAFVNATAPRTGIPLSNVGHTLDAYRRLREGWTETPKSDATDRYMWQKFLRDPSVRATTVPRPTVLYFPRDAHPGWPVPQRRDELRRWAPKTMTREGYLACLEAFCESLQHDRIALFDANEALRTRYRPLSVMMEVWLRHLQRVDLRFGGKAAAMWRRWRGRGRSGR